MLQAAQEPSTKSEWRYQGCNKLLIRECKSLKLSSGHDDKELTRNNYTINCNLIQNSPLRGSIFEVWNKELLYQIFSLWNFGIQQNEFVSITNPLMSLWGNTCSEFENIILEKIKNLFLLSNDWLVSYRSLWYWQNNSKYRIFQTWINVFSLSKSDE